MADTTTSNYNIVKPEIGASTDTWGAKQNAGFDIVDEVMKRNDGNGAPAKAAVDLKPADWVGVYDSDVAGTPIKKVLLSSLRDWLFAAASTFAAKITFAAAVNQWSNAGPDTKEEHVSISHTWVKKTGSGGFFKWVRNATGLDGGATQVTLATLDEAGGFTAAAGVNWTGAATGGTLTLSGAIRANGNGIFETYVGAQADSGNVHMYFFGVGDVARAYMYTPAASQGALAVVLGNGIGFSFNTDGSFSQYNGNVIHHNNGNISGAVWATGALHGHIESRGAAYAATACQGMRAAGYFEYVPGPGGDGGATVSGYVVVMACRLNGDAYKFGFRQLQYFINGAWNISMPF